MPGRPWPIWAAGWLALVTCPLIALIYATEATRADAGESSDIVLIASFALTAFVGMPVVTFVTYSATERYDPAGGLLVWRGDRPVRSAIVTLLLGLPAVWLAWRLLSTVEPAMPWYEWLWVPWQLLVIAWLLLVRAAAINQRDRPADPEIFS